MTENSIKLGVMPPLTGLVGIYGEEISRAAQIACAEINENGGVRGRPLQLVIEDDGSLPESAVAAAGKLVDQHRCVAIIGNLLSNSRIAVAYRVAEPRRIPYLNFSFYEGSILSRYFFHFAALPNQQIDLMIPYMRQKFGPRMFFAGNNYEWPRGSIHAAKLALERCGGEIIGEEYCPIGTDSRTLENLLDHVEATAPDVFVPYFAGIDQVHLLTRFTERGLKQRIAVVMGHYDEIMASTLPAEVREGFYSSNTYFMSVDTAENHAYLKRLARLPGVSGIWPEGNGILTNFGEGAYVCVKAFAQAANLAGTLEPEALVEALKTISVTAPQGTVQMNATHHHARVNTYLTRCEADGAFTIIEKFGPIEPVLPERYRHQQVSQRATLEDDVRLQARMLEQMSEAILLIDTQDGNIFYTNAGAEKLFGYARGEMVGLPIATLNAPLSDKAPSDTAAEIMLALRQHGGWQGEVRNIRKDGSQLWCYATVSTFTHPLHGEVWMTVQRDITERKRMEIALQSSEEAFRGTFNQAAVGIAHVGTNGAWIRVNKKLCDIIGYTEDELMHLSFQDITHADDLNADLEYVRQMLAGTIQTYSMEKRYICKQGNVAWVNLTVSMMRKPDGAPDYFISVVEDISERKRAEEELRHYKDHLEEEVQQRTADLVLARNSAEAASRAKSVFLANMSHELRTPLNAILGFSSMLRKEAALPDRQREELDIINRSGEHLLGLINDVLEMAKIESGRVQLEHAPVDLGNLVRDVTDMMQVRAKEKGLQLLIDQSSQFPRYIVGDEEKLRQVLINLVGNAIKFTGQGGVTVRLGTRINARSHLRIEIEDTGMGIAPEDRQRIFEPFVQLGEHGVNKGSGLGLTITRQYVELMGGSIAVESSPGRGTLFRVELPLLEASEEEIASSPVSRQGRMAEIVPGQPVYRMLIVEDQQENQLLLARLMEAIGMPYRIAGDGEQGVQAFRDWQPHLIWMDRRMPVMDGMQATKIIRSLPVGKEVKIVAVTASAFQEQREEMLAAGMDDFVRKPYRINEIYGCLARQLGLKFTQESMPPEQETVSELTAESLAVLPQALRKELRDALESLEGDRIAQAIEAVGACEAGLQKHLARLVEKFDYPAILKALNGIDHE